MPFLLARSLGVRQNVAALARATLRNPISRRESELSLRQPWPCGIARPHHLYPTHSIWNSITAAVKSNSAQTNAPSRVPNTRTPIDVFSQYVSQTPRYKCDLSPMAFVSRVARPTRPLVDSRGKKRGCTERKRMNFKCSRFNVPNQHNTSWDVLWTFLCWLGEYFQFTTLLLLILFYSLMTA